MSLELRAVRLDDPDALALIEHVQAEYVVRYGGPDESPMDPDTFAPPRGLFFVGYADGLPVSMGGWRLRPDLNVLDGSRVAEVKRMFVLADSRRRGFSRAVLARLEDSARDDGVDVLVMETGVMQPEALALYASSGYVTVDGFGYYKDSPLSRYFGKRL